MTTSLRELITQLRAALQALGDYRDCHSDNQKATYFATYNATQSCISALMNLPEDIARCAERLADAEIEHAKWTASHQELREALDAKRLEGEVHTQELERRHTYVQHFSERISALRIRHDRDAASLEHNIKLANELLASRASRSAA
jgi:chromosome segregation ATPase